MTSRQSGRRTATTYQRAAGGVVAEKHEPVINTWFWGGQGTESHAVILTTACDQSSHQSRHITSNSPSLAPSTNASHSAGVKISVWSSTGCSELRIAT
jgi:hypothetical protein